MAPQGRGEVRFRLGMMDQDGAGVDKDLRKAAEQRDADAQFNLGED